jgi:hypothetical protein
MNLDEALAWTGKTIDERLREARRTGTDSDYDWSNEACIDTLAAEVRRYHSMRCETCRFCERQDRIGRRDPYCLKSVRERRADVIYGDEYSLYTRCADLGGGCRAWEKRDD